MQYDAIGLLSMKQTLYSRPSPADMFKFQPTHLQSNDSTGS